MLDDLKFRCRALFRRNQVDAELEDELSFHLEQQQQALQRSGMSPDEAARRARLSLGGVAQAQEECRDTWGIALLETVWQDARFGARMLRKNLGFTVAAVATLALGIGANCAIFSVVNAVLLRPLPFRDPARLVTVLETKATQHLDWLYVTGVNFVEWQRRQQSFEALAASYGCDYRLPDATEVRMVHGTCTSASFFPLLGVRPLLGRVWTENEDLSGRDRVAVLSYDTWQREFGGDRAVIGKTVLRTLDQQPFTVIGVLPSDFQFASEEIGVWTPLGLDPAAASYRFHRLLVFGRLKPGVSIAEANSQMAGIAAQLEKEYPQSNTGWGVTVGPMQRFFSDLGNTRAMLLVLLAAVAALLLIACVNVANLLLARATARQREVAVRAAIGATRQRLIRQLLTESVILALLGGGLGLALAYVSFPRMLAMAPQIPSFRPHALRMDYQVLAFCMGLSLLAAVIFGVLPALRISGLELSQRLREAGRGAMGTLRQRISRNVLVVGEIALAIVLLIGTGLFLATLHNLQQDRLGYNTGKLLTMSVCCLDTNRYATQQQTSDFYRQLFERLRALPGVKAASATSTLPMRQFDGAGSVVLIKGAPPAEPGKETVSDFRLVEPDYFHTMEIPLLRGRLLTPADDESHDPVAVINENFARRYWPDKDAIGQGLKIGSLQGPWYRVIGVVANSKDRGLGKEIRTTVYMSDIQNNGFVVRGFNLLVRVQGDPLALAPSVREAVRSLNRDVTIGDARSFDDRLAESLAPQKFSVTLLSLFAGVALLLACIGVYGLTAYVVAQRTHEIGVRLALGARPRDVLLLVLGQGGRLAVAGIALGVAAAIVSTRMMATLLFGVNAHDPATLVIVSLILGLVTLLACCVPARRAMRVDPVVALRFD